MLECAVKWRRALCMAMAWDLESSAAELWNVLALSVGATGTVAAHCSTPKVATL
jgi:hypothetical protein